MRTEFWLENLKGRGHLGELGIDGRISILKYKQKDRSSNRGAGGKATKSDLGGSYVKGI